MSNPEGTVNCELAQCDNCGHVEPVAKLGPIRNYSERVDSDEEPDGECTRCGALSYAISSAGEEAQSMNLKELKAERDRLRAIFDHNGGRGVCLADEIDEIEARIAVLEHPFDLDEAIKIVLKVAVQNVETNGYPDDETIADTEQLRNVYIEHAFDLVKAHLKRVAK